MSELRIIEQRDWQPIEAAPKDGTPKLCMAAGWSWPRIAVESTFGEWRDNTSNVYCSPTHWMPLPDPPNHGE